MIAFLDHPNIRSGTVANDPMRNTTHEFWGVVGA